MHADAEARIRKVVPARRRAGSSAKKERAAAAGLTPRVDFTDKDLMLLLSGTTDRVAAFLAAALEAGTPPDAVHAAPEGIAYLQERFGGDVHIDLDADLAGKSVEVVVA